MKKTGIYSATAMLVLLTGSIYADDVSGGKFYDYKKKIVNLEKQQIEIETWVKQTNVFLAEYEGFINDYRKIITSIKVDGANCIIYKEKYNHSYNKFGATSYQSKTYKVMYSDCKNMKTNRLSALKTVKSRVDNMKHKVNELKTKLDMVGDKEKQIMAYIRKLRQDRQFINRYKST